MQSPENLESVTVGSPDGALQAEFVPRANLLCRSLRHRGVELLYPGHGLAAYVTHGKTMGIPLLHPWANRLAGPAYEVAGKRVTLDGDGSGAEGRFPTDPNGLPMHGVLPSLLRWELESATTGPLVHRLAARLRWSSPPLLALFPFEHELAVEATVSDDALTLVTTLRATGGDRVPVAFGYHPYLIVPGAHRRDWRVTLGAARRLVLDDRMIPTGRREPLERREFLLGDESWDDGLDELTSPPLFAASAGDRAITVVFEEGYDFAQVYAPPGHDFICFEPMTAPANALISGDGLAFVAPGGEYRAAFSVRIIDRADREAGAP